jgi:hypothetical protein
VKGEQANIAVAIGCSASDTRKLLDHVGFVGEVEVHLDGRRAIHHVEAARADQRHVAAHHLVAALGHARRLGEGRLGREADAEKTDADRRAGSQALAQVLVRLGTDLVHGPEWIAGQLELTAGSSETVPPACPSGRLRAMMLSPSMIGSHPNWLLSPSIKARTPRGPA